MTLKDGTSVTGFSIESDLAMTSAVPTPDDALTPVHQIAKALWRGEVGFLFGAGMSKPAPSSLPSGGELADRLLVEAFGQRHVSPELKRRVAYSISLERLADSAEALLAGGRPQLRRFLEQHLDGPGEPNEGHDAIVEMYANHREWMPNELYTTNFDKLIERAFGNAAAITISAENIGTDPGDKIPVIHLHGLVEPGSLFCITESDLRSPEPDVERLMRDFGHSLQKDIFVFVGYSMQDQDIANVYWSVREAWDDHRRGEAKHTYVVGQTAHDKEAELLESLWRKRGAVFLDMDAVVFMKALAAELSILKVRETEEWLVREYGGAEGLQEILSDLMSRHNFNEPQAIKFLAGLVGREDD